MKIIFASLLSLSATAAFAQQSPLLSMFWNNYTLINPAASGLYYKQQASASYRNQRDKVNGAPNTLSAGYNMKIDALHSGIGINYLHDAIGFTRNHRVDLNYSYHFKIGENGILSAGISGGVSMYGMDPTWIPPANPQDPSLPVSGTGKGSAFVANAGAVYKARAFSVGLSVTQLNNPTVRNVFYSIEPNYMLFADYNFAINSKLDLKPQVSMRTDAVKFSADINVLAYYRKQYWAGMSYRTNDALAFMLGWDIREKFRIGYSYDLTINQLSSISKGTHEIALGFLLKN